MKKPIKLLSLIIIFSALWSCEEDDNVNFILEEPSENIEFTNGFLGKYLLSEETSSNIAERLVWDPISFGAPTVITYTLEGSIDNMEFEEISSTTNNNVAVTVGQLLIFAEALGLDNDPNSDDGAGGPNNNGTVYLRVNANPGGNGAANAPETVSEVISLNIELIEVQTGPALEPIQISAFGLVGEAINEWGGAGSDLPMYSRGDGVHFVALNNPGEGTQFKIRENNEWVVVYGTGAMEGSISTEGFDNNFVFPEGEIIVISMDIENLTISINTGDSWGIVGDAINNFGADGPDIRLTEDPENPGLWFAIGVDLPQGQAKFRLNNDWNNNWGPGENDTIVQGSFDNFQVDEGVYNVTLDLSTSGSESATFEES